MADNPTGVTVLLTGTQGAAELKASGSSSCTMHR